MFIIYDPDAWVQTVTQKLKLMKIRNYYSPHDTFGRTKQIVTIQIDHPLYTHPHTHLPRYHHEEEEGPKCHVIPFTLSILYIIDICSQRVGVFLFFSNYYPKALLESLSWSIDLAIKFLCCLWHCLKPQTTTQYNRPKTKVSLLSAF